MEPRETRVSPVFQEPRACLDFQAEMDLMETTVPPEHRAPTAPPESLDPLVWMAPREDPDQLDPKEMTDSPEHPAKTAFLVCQEPKETPDCQAFPETMDDWELKEKEA